MVLSKKNRRIPPDTSWFNNNSRILKAGQTSTANRFARSPEICSSRHASNFSVPLRPRRPVGPVKLNGKQITYRVISGCTCSAVCNERVDCRRRGSIPKTNFACQPMQVPSGRPAMHSTPPSPPAPCNRANDEPSGTVRRASRQQRSSKASHWLPRRGTIDRKSMSKNNPPYNKSRKLTASSRRVKKETN